MRLIFRSSLLVLGGLSAGVLSCSNFILPTSDDLGAVISGRTMDLGWYVIDRAQSYTRVRARVARTHSYAHVHSHAHTRTYTHIHTHTRTHTAHNTHANTTQYDRWDSWELISIPAGQHPGWDGMGINMTSDPTLSYGG